jgi:hypothetical protein
MTHVTVEDAAPRRTVRLLALVFGAVAFGIAATANSGGYRYGASDQAFYTVAVVKAIHPDAFPHDTPLIVAESRLMVTDRLLAVMSRVLNLNLPVLYVVLYGATLVLLFSGAVSFGRHAGFSSWATVIFLLLLTLRHQITKTAANSLEGYMHPRMLAFALGIWAFAYVLNGRYGPALAAIAAAGVWHPTTAFWFAIVVWVALFVSRPQWRAWTGGLAALVVVVGLWMVFAGPLAGRLVPMDAAWLSVLAGKDYLFPHEWPISAWLLNLAMPAVILIVYRRRRQLGVVAPGEPGLVAGLLVLVAGFLVSLPFTMARIAFAVQMQVTRVFWLIDFCTAAYIAWWIADDWLAVRSRARPIAVALLTAFSIGRGAFLLSQDRQLVRVGLPDSPWVDVLDWVRRQPTPWYVLADPLHAWKYGLSARLVAEKDTFVEIGKDTAIAMYDRNIALGVGERLAAAGGFEQLTTEQARALAARYGLDVLIVEARHAFDLPELYRNREFVVYKLS